jgi:hypothetical protein
MLTFYGCAKSEDSENKNRRNNVLIFAIWLIKGMLTFWLAVRRRIGEVITLFLRFFWSCGLAAGRNWAACPVGDGAGWRALVMATSVAAGFLAAFLDCA